MLLHYLLISKTLLARSFFFLLVGSVSAESINLWQAYQLSLNSEEGFAIAKQNVIIQEQNKLQVRAALLPRINFSRSFTDDEYRGLGAGSSYRPDHTSVTSERNTVSISQSIFNYADISSHKKAKYMLTAEKLRYEDSVQNLILSITSSYFAILDKEVELASFLADLKFIEDHKEVVKKRYKVHQSTNIDLSEVEVNYQLTLSNVQSGRNNLRASKLALASYIGRIDTNYHVKEVVPDSVSDMVITEDFEYWLNLAQKNNQSLKMQKYLLKAAKQEVYTARAGHYPTVDFSAFLTENAEKNYYSSNPNETYQIQLSIPVFQGFYTNARLSQARAELKRSKLNLESVKKSLIKELRIAYNNVLFYKERIKTSASTVKYSALKLKETEKSFHLNLRTNDDFLDAQSGLQNAKKSYIQVLHKYLLSYLTLRKIAGVLSEQDIKQLNIMLAA